MNGLFPTTDPVLIVAIATFFFLVAPPLVERFRLPGIVGLILAGALVGPNGLGLLLRDATIELLGAVGLLYLMFVAGLDLDLAGFKRHRGRSFLFGAISFALPFGLALPVMSLLGFSLPAAVLVGAVVASHTLLALPVAGRLGVARDAAVTTVVGGTLLTDGLSLGALAVVDAASTGVPGAAFWATLVLALAMYLALSAWALPRLGRWFFRNAEGESTLRFLFLMAVLFASSYAADVAGAQPIIGAFLAGLLLNRLLPEQSPLMSRVRFFGDAFFIPFFLFSVGMLFDARALIGGPRILAIAGALIALVLIGKGAAALASGRMLGFTPAQATLMAGLSMPQAAATLAVTFVGLEIGLFDDDVVSGVIVLILVSCVIGATLVERAGRAVALSREREPDRGDTAPHRILVPLANPNTAEALMELAMLIREPDSGEPVFPMTVVSGDDAPPGAVAAAERMLAHAVVHAAEADVPANPLTRIAHNPAAGIARAVAERRITDIVIGWRGRTTALPEVVFGNVIDQTLHLADPHILVCRLQRPVATHERLVAIFPPRIDLNPGFYQVSRTLKLLASRLGIRALALAVADPSSGPAAARIALRMRDVLPEMELAAHDLDGWPDLFRWIEEEAKPSDLVFVASARRGTLAHSHHLERLPTDLTRLSADFIAFYASETPPPDQPRHDAVGLPRLLAPQRVAFDLDGDYGGAIERLLSIAIRDGPPRAAATAALLGEGSERSVEVLPGVLLLHARVKRLNEPLLCFGVHREGFDHPRAGGLLHGICILIDPEDMPMQRHLANLAEVAEQIAHGGSIAQLLECASIADLERWFGSKRT